MLFILVIEICQLRYAILFAIIMKTISLHLTFIGTYLSFRYLKKYTVLIHPQVTEDMLPKILTLLFPKNDSVTSRI